METSFNIANANRNILLGFMNELNFNQLTTIPSGFKNNIIWNIGHIVVVQQLLVYHLSGLPPKISIEIIEKFKKGTLPQNITEEDVAEIKALLFSTIETTKIDYQNNVFVDYTPFTTMSGFTVDSAKTAIEFNNFHEGVHIGIIMQLRKFI
ncbi:DinB family protein [Flavobacterium sp.]|uniref:DinB family protein n=1 Tax=Flavobacterium sp. TaxID=239 RepID=UPI003529A463